MAHRYKFHQATMSTLKTIGIYGGTFNPIHIGHTSLAQAICETGVVDEVWFMVSPLNPLKKDSSKIILPTDTRIKMARMAVKNCTCLNVSDFETKLPVPSYTITTLTELKKEFPQNIFSLLVGEDNWQRFGQWYHADEIKANFDIIVYGRNGEQNDAAINKNVSWAQVTLYKKDGNDVRLSSNYKKFKLFDISSTQIREAFKSRNLPFAAKWLHPDVFRFILENGFFA